MKKIIVIGCPGAGKTTFAQKLCDKTRLPLFYLDAIWHKPDRTHIPREEFDLRLGEILARDAWIIDGNYSRTVERRMAECDTVFLFDLPVEDCLAGAIARLGKKRDDLPFVDTELDPALRAQIEAFESQNLPSLYEAIERHGADKRVVIFRSREEADAFLLRCAQKGSEDMV